MQQATKKFADSTLRLHKIFGRFGGTGHVCGGVDADYQTPLDMSVVVATSTSDGAIEANATHSTTCSTTSRLAIRP